MGRLTDKAGDADRAADLRKEGLVATKDADNKRPKSLRGLTNKMYGESPRLPDRKIDRETSVPASSMEMPTAYWPGIMFWTATIAIDDVAACPFLISK